LSVGSKKIRIKRRNPPVARAVLPRTGVEYRKTASIENICPGMLQAARTVFRGSVTCM
jgi:hypothetical protein